MKVEFEYIGKGEIPEIFVQVHICPFCRFKGALKAVEKCWKCDGTLIFCPKCVTKYCACLHMVDYALNSPQYTVSVQR